MSPPSRAAWIEMGMGQLICLAIVSPPSRAAWIEMDSLRNGKCTQNVAAFTGGVD